MNIGFYGHSTCAFDGEHSHIKIVADTLKATILNIGVRQGSEERILHELKKTKNLDIAIVFHSHPRCLYLPNSDRDIDVTQQLEYKADYLFKNWEEYTLRHSDFVSKFKNPDNFVGVMNNYKEYMYTPELHLDRFHGAMIQIDQYITSKHIPVIHVVNNQIPSWFKFTSGIIDTDIDDICKRHLPVNGEWSRNGINMTGNHVIAIRLIEHINKLIKE